MACRTVLRGVFLTEPWRPLRSNLSCCSSLSYPRNAALCSARRMSCEYTGPADTMYFGSAWTQQQQQQLSCSGNDAASPSSSDPSEDDQEQNPPQEAVLKAISEVSKTQGRVGQTTNVVIGGTVTDDSSNEWLALDKKVNTYPTVRGFTAIGTGGDDFVQAMVVAVESVIQQPIPKGRVKQKLSSQGKYVSVNIGPIQVISSEQVQAVYNAMRRDDRMKYFL
ncbi:uncharacterized protein LOC116201296 [Punica granatum]|uniref:Uncharacterized protein n=2 Tax=Punica granatum TaxID=22663 RepID=A0A2I0IEQ1_PUNGR|nr:uncharacterized protein LOC116201296 [Punica granatum]PKI42273.1 hypothetical protein CRG98_037324 [Punica granatum]